MILGTLLDTGRLGSYGVLVLRLRPTTCLGGNVRSFLSGNGNMTYDACMHILLGGFCYEWDKLIRATSGWFLLTLAMAV